MRVSKPRRSLSHYKLTMGSCVLAVWASDALEVGGRNGRCEGNKDSGEFEGHCDAEDAEDKERDSTTGAE